MPIRSLRNQQTRSDRDWGSDPGGGGSGLPAGERCGHCPPAVQLPGARNAWKAAENDRELRGRGITVRKTIDGIIATACMEANLPLLFSERDYAGFTDLPAPGRIAPPWPD